MTNPPENRHFQAASRRWKPVDSSRRWLKRCDTVMPWMWCIGTDGDVTGRERVGTDSFKGKPCLALEKCGDSHFRWKRRLYKKNQKNIKSSTENTARLETSEMFALQTGMRKDFKPHNILLASPLRPGQPDVVKLVDFGLSKDCQNPSNTSISNSTSPGRTLAAVPQGPRRLFWEPSITGAVPESAFQV